MRIKPFTLVVLFILCFSISGHAESRYTAILLNGDGLEGVAVNDSGVVVGHIVNDTYDRPFVWNESTGVQILEALPGSIMSEAVDINNSGVIVGSYFGDTGYKGFVYTSNEGMRDIGTLGGNITYVSGINESGMVTGRSTTNREGEPFHAFVWTEANGMVDIIGDAFGDNDSSSIAINDAGIATLYKHHYSPTTYLAAYIWDSTNGPQSIGPFPEMESEALDINNNSVVVGFYRPAQQWRQNSAYSWTESGGIVTLPTFPDVWSTTARAINDHGVIVGSYRLRIGSTSDFKNSALFWKDSEVFDLNSVTELAEGWELSIAYDINTHGQIVCVGKANGEKATFLLTPVSHSKTLVPVTTLLLN